MCVSAHRHPNTKVHLLFSKHVTSASVGSMHTQQSKSACLPHPTHRLFRIVAVLHVIISDVQRIDPYNSYVLSRQVFRSLRLHVAYLCKLLRVLLGFVTEAVVPGYLVIVDARFSIVRNFKEK